MGLVYRAYHPQLERTGAVKVLQAISPDADTVARFRHEAQAIAKLRHPNIVDVYDFGEYQGTPYMIVEYVPGGSLAAKMANGPLEPAAAMRYLRGIAAGLDYAHSHGVVHRDVKPANVLLTTEDTPVLADFGLAKLLQGTSLKSMTGVTTGTPAYMAPEQVTGGTVTPAADRYSLATIAYEMLCGVIPFDGQALMELLYAQVHREPPRPSSRSAALGPQVDAVVMRGLAKDPAARWESSTAFVDALGAALNGIAAPAPSLAKTMVMAPNSVASTVPLVAPTVPIAAPAQALVPRSAAPATVAMPFPAPAGPTPAAQPKKSRKRLIAMIAGGLIVAFLLFVVLAALIARGAPTLTLSSYTVQPGEDIVVTATHVPANQAGQIQMYSVVHTFPFRADASGQVSLDITVPRDLGFGDHVVKLCYNNSCHAQTTLHVVSHVALASPTPIGNPTSGSTPTPTSGSQSTPTPGMTPRPTATPPSTSTPKPTSTPPPCSPSFSVPSISLTSGFTAYFNCFQIGSVWAVTLYWKDPVLGWQSSYRGSATVNKSNYSQPFTMPTGPLLQDPAYVKACSGATCYMSPSPPVNIGA